MRLERERHLEAGLYERNPERRGYANGYKPKKLDTPGRRYHRAGSEGQRHRGAEPVGVAMVAERQILLPRVPERFDLVDVTFPLVDKQGCVTVKTNSTLPPSSAAGPLSI